MAALERNCTEHCMTPTSAITRTGSPSRPLSPLRPIKWRSRPAVAAEGVERERPPLLQLQARSPTRSIFTRSSQRATKWRARMERREGGGLLPPDHSWNVPKMLKSMQEIARILHNELRALRAQAGADHRVSPLCQLRSGLSRHHAVLREHRLYRRPQGPRRHRHGLLRHRARDGPSMVGAPGDRRRTCKARRCCRKPWPNTRH